MAISAMPSHGAALNQTGSMLDLLIFDWELPGRGNSTKQTPTVKSTVGVIGRTARHKANSTALKSHSSRARIKFPPSPSQGLD